VQGSARIKLPDGTELRLGYAGKNEHPYTSLGGLLVKDGRVPKDRMSLTAIKEYFAAHPEELDYYVYQNPSYVFFQENQGGPYGCLGVTVTPYHSLATDKKVFPPGCIGFFDAELPVWTSLDTIGFQPTARFALDQDRGGAIRSAGRSDIFLGTGPPAERLAGYMQREGRLYYIFVKGGAAP
jgi:membrane-bound lytic murein transglycosylase A